MPIWIQRPGDGPVSSACASISSVAASTVNGTPSPGTARPQGRCGRRRTRRHRPARAAAARCARSRTGGTARWPRGPLKRTWSRSENTSSSGATPGCSWRLTRMRRAAVLVAVSAGDRRAGGVRQDAAPGSQTERHEPGRRARAPEPGRPTRRSTRASEPCWRAPNTVRSSASAAIADVVPAAVRRTRPRRLGLGRGHGAESANGTTWGSYAVTGTWDGATADGDRGRGTSRRE